MQGSIYQSRKSSAVEAVNNTVIGYLVAVLSQLVIFPAYGVELTLAAHLVVGVLYTVQSMARSYVLRRLFNRWHGRQTRWQSLVESWANILTGYTLRRLYNRQLAEPLAPVTPHCP